MIQIPAGEECAEGPINPNAEAKRLRANLAIPGKAKIARERKIQTNPVGKKRCTRGQKNQPISANKCKKV